MLESSALRSFADNGYIVVRDAVPENLVDSTNRVIDRLLAEQPPPDKHLGHHFYWRNASQLGAIEPFLVVLLENPVFAIAQSLVKPHELQIPTQAQVALNMPPHLRRPGGPHIDGLTPPEASGRPGTFTLLAGILLSDQQLEDIGNLWVWPGTHLSSSAYFREHGADALTSCTPYPPVPLSLPTQVLGRAGDLVLAHYMLGHNIGGNTSSLIRRALYFRLRCVGHEERWRECVQDAWTEFRPIRSACFDQV